MLPAVCLSVCLPPGSLIFSLKLELALGWRQGLAQRLRLGLCLGLSLSLSLGPRLDLSLGIFN